MGMLNNKKVLITGASGFIGSHLTTRLISEGADVTVVVRYNSIEHNVRLISLWNNVRIFEADIRNIESLLPFRKEKFDYVFHLAAYNHVGNSFNHFGEAMDTNSNGTANLLESLSDYERLVYISTSEVYGLQDTGLFVEHKYPHPSSPYSIGKYAGELYSIMKYKETGHPIVVLRPFNAFGPYQSMRAVIPELIINCLRGVPVLTTEGKQTREFNFVSNLTEGMLLASQADNVLGEVINLGTGKDVPICDVARLIHKMTNSKSDLRIGALPTRPNEIWEMRSDASKAQELLNWESKIDYESGLAITIEWFAKYYELYYSGNSNLLNLSNYVIK